MGVRPPTRRQTTAYNYSIMGRDVFLREHRGWVVRDHFDRYLRETFGDRPWSMLDVGGGSGALSDYLHELSPQSRSTVLDISPDLLESNSRGAWKTIVQGSATELAAHVGQQRYDLVCIHNLLHHVVDGSYRSSGRRVESVLRQAREVLAPGGRLSLFEMSYRGWPVETLCGRLIFELTSSRVLGPLCRPFGANTGGVGVRFLPETTWRHLLDQSQFEILELVKVDPFRFPLYVRIPLLMRVAEPVHFWCKARG